MRGLQVADLRFRSVFALGYLAFLALAVPFFLLAGLLALNPASTAIVLNGQPAHGPVALAAALGAAVVLPLVPAVLMTLGAVVLRLVGAGRAPLGPLADRG